MSGQADALASLGVLVVDDERVVGEVLESLDGVGRIGRLGDLEAVGAQGFGDELAEIGLIIDDQDGGLGGAGHGMRSCLCARFQPTARSRCMSGPKAGAILT